MLDNNIFSHYQILLSNYAPEDRFEFKAIVPSVLQVFDCSLQYRGQEVYQINEENKFLHKYILVLGGQVAVELLADEENRLLKASIPAQAFSAIRKGYDILELKEEELSSEIIKEDFTVLSAEKIELAGSAIFPAVGNTPFPALLLISGSGGHDRDGNIPGALYSDLFKQIAEKAATAGFAVYSYDERGVGESTGVYQQAGLYDLTDDARAVLNLMKNDAKIDNSRIIILGHSEGGLIAPMVAVDDDEIAGCIILAGPSISLDQLIIEQLKFQSDHSDLSSQEQEVARQALPMARKYLEQVEQGIEPEVLLFPVKWIKEHKEQDPEKIIRSLDMPLLIIQGEKDLMVKPYHADRLAEAAEKAGNQDVQVHHLKNITHLFTQFPYNNPAYDPENALAITDELFIIITDWLNARF